MSECNDSHFIRLTIDFFAKISRRLVKSHESTTQSLQTQDSNKKNFVFYCALIKTLRNSLKAIWTSSHDRFPYLRRVLGEVFSKKKHRKKYSKELCGRQRRWWHLWSCCWDAWKSRVVFQSKSSRCCFATRHCCSHDVIKRALVASFNISLSSNRASKSTTKSRVKLNEEGVVSNRDQMMLTDGSSTKFNVCRLQIFSISKVWKLFLAD